MGEGTDRAVREIEAARERIQGDLEELAVRLPEAGLAAAAAAKKAVFPLVGAAAGAVVVWAIDRRGRRRRAAREAAAALVPDDWMQVFREGAWKGPAAAALGVWAVMRIAEGRAVRRLSKALVRGLPS